MIIRRTLIGAGGVAIAGLVALLALFAGAGVAGAQTPPPATSSGGIVRYAGTIKEIKTGGFTLDTRRGATVDVTTTDRTWFVVKNNGSRAEGALSDLAAGDKVEVAGVSTGDNKVEARVVTEVPLEPARGGRPGPGPGRVGGFPTSIQATVQAITGTVMTLTGPQGRISFTINTDGSTLFIKDGFASIDAFKVGDKVYVVPRMMRPAAGAAPDQASGTRPTLTAAAVISAGDADAIALGVVQSVDGNKITLRTLRRQPTTVTVDSSTGYRKFDATTQAPTSAALSDVAQGTAVLVYGGKVSGQNNTIAAKAIVVLPSFDRAPQRDAPFAAPGWRPHMPRRGPATGRDI